MKKAEEQKDLSVIDKLITTHPDFPKKGILFYDIFPVLRNPTARNFLITRLSTHIQQTFGDEVDAVVGLESRGFLLGPPVAERLNVSFVPIRKKGKLPGKCVSLGYTKEYGEDAIEIQMDSLKPNAKVIVIDDLLATGGTLRSSIGLLKKVKAEILESVVVIELVDLAGRKAVEGQVFSLFKK